MSQQHKNPAPNQEPGAIAPTAAMPDNMMGMIADLLSQQQRWQQRQSESEQLIARMAEKLEHSQKSIETLTGMLSETPETEHQVPGPPQDDSPPDNDDGARSWESQKQILMADYGELPSPLLDPEPPGITPDPVPEKQPVAAEPSVALSAESEPDSKPETKASSSFQAVSEEELEALGDCRQSSAVRWLRVKLEEKLRDAEIEISIERARIHRAKRELEQQRIEFEREVVRMRDEEKSTGKGKNKNKKTKQNRWARFLGESNESGS